MLELGGRRIEDLGLGYDLAVDPQTGGATLRVPVPVPPGRDGFAPQLALLYTAGGSNSAFGAGWALDGLPAIAIDTSEHVPRWDGSDGYALGGAPLVPWLEQVSGTWQPRGHLTAEHSIAYYRVRIGAASVRVEKWVELATGRVHFRTRDASNVVTVFGARANDEARVADPDDPSRTLTWLPEVSIAPTGNAQWFDYVADGAQRYLTRVRYGNVIPIAYGDDASATRWCFHVELDYGARDDVFTSHRAGFAVRTDRLCTRIASLHEFDDLGPAPTLVGELAFVHDRDPAGALLRELVWTGHRNDGSSRSVPALRMTYAPAALGDAFDAAPAETLENAPGGLGARHQLVDLHGDGLAGILSESDRTWFYKPNLGGGRFGAQTQVLERPATQPGAYAFADVDRNGDVDVARLSGRFAGHYAHDRERGHWQPFRPISAMPHVEALGGRVDWIDLDGDGRPEIVVAKSDRLVWFRAADDGFAAPIEIPLPAGAHAAPTIGADPTLDLFFADMDGDGLVDLVRVENGRIEYWPSLGNGRFGDGIVIDGGPLAPDGDFEAVRVRFVDLDGSGTADLIYIGRGELTVWTNASGTRLVPSRRMRGVPFIDNVSTAQVLDILGNGQPCLVWSSPLPGHAALHYLPLTPELAPRLLVAVEDGLGAETRVAYSSSATHYLRDVAAGRGWSTLLPSHVTVVDRREVIDHIGGTHRVERFAYHDGFFDGRERTFRGFAQVDVFDAEAADGAAPQPGEPAFAAPLLTRTWFHVGVPPWGPHRPLDFYAEDADLPTLVAHAFDDLDLAPDEAEDAVRALAGSPIRVERYAIDEHGTASEHPFDVVQSTYRVRRAQPETRTARAAFAVIPQDTLSAIYEQTAGDPRITHTVAIETDAFDQTRSTADIAYPRRAGRPRDVAAQDRFEVLIAELDLVHIDEPDRFQLGVVVEARESELTGLPASLVERARLRAPDIVAALAAPHPHHVTPAGIAARRTSWNRTFYWEAARTAAAPLGEVSVPALLHHVEAACFTPELVAEIFDTRIDDARLIALGYSLRDGHWWQSDDTRLVGSPDLFLRTLGDDQLRLEYDAHALIVAAHTDALGNRTEAVIDYHALAPRAVIDANGNLSEVMLDPLGVATRSSQHGHLGAQPWGFAPLTPGPIGDTAEVIADPARFLGSAATATVYDLDAWRRDRSPTQLVTLGSEQLAQDGRGAGIIDGPIYLSVTYVDGRGGTLQTKTREASDRWRTSGHVVFDTKGRPALEYDPYFAADAAFDGDAARQHFGISTLTRYDALGRIVGRDFPDATSEQTRIGPWSSDALDRNDTVLDSAYRALRESRPLDDPERQALEHARSHAGTPTRVFLDSRGREVGTLAIGGMVADRRTEQRLATDGSTIAIVDPRGLVAFEIVRDMQGRTLVSRSLDAGTASQLLDARDRVATLFDPRGFEVEYGYDRLDRPTTTDVRGNGLDHRVEVREYGEALPEPEAKVRNLRGRLVVLRDESGVRTVEQREPRGDVATLTFELRTDSGVPDWRQAVRLDGERLVHETDRDARGRSRRARLPDGIERIVTYAGGGGIADLRVSTADGGVAATVSTLEYDASGMLTKRRLGNGVEIEYRHDPWTRQMTGQRAQRGTRVYQDVTYTYDPAGHLVSTRGRDAQHRYRYDAHGRLVFATGRVHPMLLGRDYGPTQHLALDNLAVLEPYERTYGYDPSGNRTFMRHASQSRTFKTDMWISTSSNRSLPRRDDNGIDVQQPETRFDAAGNLSELAHLRRLEWSWRGSLTRTILIDRGGSPADDEVYTYRSEGTRVRKVATRVLHGGQVETVEVLSLDDCERTRIRRDGRVIVERWTSSFDDGAERVAVLHRWTLDEPGREIDDPTTARWHYQLGTLLGSSAFELDDRGDVISYEEYFPYGGTAFFAARSDRDVELKAYRYVGKVRDATGLYDHGQRYYAPWIGRWLSPDPTGPADDVNLYQFVLGNPIGNFDPDGLRTVSREDERRRPSQDEGPPNASSPPQLLPTDPTPQRGGSGLRSADRLRGSNKGIPIPRKRGAGAAKDRGGQAASSGGGVVPSIIEPQPVLGPGIAPSGSDGDDGGGKVLQDDAPIEPDDRGDDGAAQRTEEGDTDVAPPDLIQVTLDFDPKPGGRALIPERLEAERFEVPDIFVDRKDTRAPADGLQGTGRVGNEPRPAVSGTGTVTGGRVDPRLSSTVTDGVAVPDLTRPSGELSPHGTAEPSTLRKVLATALALVGIGTSLLQIAKGVALLFAPEPLLTKFLGLAIIAHGVSSLVSIVSQQPSYVARGVSGIARVLGVEASSAQGLGTIVDVGAGIAFSGGSTLTRVLGKKAVYNFGGIEIRGARSLENLKGWELARVIAGFAPRVRNRFGKWDSVTLHHYKQWTVELGGGLWKRQVRHLNEVLSSAHNAATRSRALHPRTGDAAYRSIIDRTSFALFRQEYWRARGIEELLRRVFSNQRAGIRF